MRSSRRSKRARNLVTTAAIAIFGCNVILNNEPGTLAPSTSATVSPAAPVPEAGEPLFDANVDDVAPSEAAAPPDEPDANTDPECTPNQRLCHGKCVFETDPTHGCGAPSCKPCAETDHAATVCRDGHCAFDCETLYHECDGRCVSRTDPMHCGPSCAPCPKAAHATTTCDDDACHIECDDGFDDCNHDTADGCESRLATDPRACGRCGRSCDSGTCNNGECVSPPDAGPPPDASADASPP
ncbi:MAG TPA: hypothetical protein VM580_25440 [Labilithrix sp.]|nr:hypothetical protein [Labilithrix sp.]